MTSDQHDHAVYLLVDDLDDQLESRLRVIQLALPEGLDQSVRQSRLRARVDVPELVPVGPQTLYFLGWLVYGDDYDGRLRFPSVPCMNVVCRHYQELYQQLSIASLRPT